MISIQFSINSNNYVVSFLFYLSGAYCIGLLVLDNIEVSIIVIIITIIDTRSNEEKNALIALRILM